ncbi:Recombination protein MgsA [Alteribacillus persepolensis]|uniref:Recombination protein MgsA n=1 Tax=Alteribacillus persepolensis TaxID=568899 RepID=A0A1G8DJ49_9BACI|nr:replication-associated recombination protein A [Alteribacillus persepolensis]SDH57697.1 Recombination protein MgsA [Alteribacillus persepolensis]
MKYEPLAYRMRPSVLEEVIGQDHVLAEGKPLFQMIKKQHLTSMILYGRPGIGKTSIAHAFAGSSGLRFRMLNATSSSKKDLETVVNEAKMYRETMALCVDEIHRFSKTQIEFLLPHLEKGLLILIGLTSENPYHHINPAIRSRCLIFELQPLKKRDIVKGLQYTINNEEKGLGKYNIDIEDETLETIADISGGDMRQALNKLEISFLAAEEDENGRIRITLETVKDTIQKNDVNIDKSGDSHYNVLSGFHKALRGGDVDAACLMLALLIEAGDLIGISRRVLCVAYEDVGLAKPEMGERALAAIQTAERLGFPEARIPLANIVIELCLSPKSNRAYMAVNEALEYVRSGKKVTVPNHLKDTHYQGAKELGHGNDYKYPHDYQIGKFGGWVAQQYLPSGMENMSFYHPLEAGQEEKYKKLYEKLKQEQLRQLNRL